LTVGAGTSTTSIINSNTSGSTGVTLSASTGLSISESGNVITLTNTAPDQTVSLTGAGITNVTGTYPNFTITSTEVDGSTTNELQAYGHAGTTTYTNTLSGGGGSWSITGAGIAAISQTGGAITVTATEVDGSTTNELQTISVASNTTTLSNSGGSMTIAGAGINTVGTAGSTITITGTEVDGSISNEGSLTVGAGSGTTSIINSNTSGSTGVTITAGSGLTISETGNVITLANSAPDQTVSITGAGINAVTGTYPNFTITGTEVDGSVTNEAQSLTVTGTTSGKITLSTAGRGGGGTATIAAGTGITVAQSAGTITITNSSPATTGNLTAGSTKVAVTGGTGAVIGSGSTVDVVPGNILLSTLGGSLNLSQIAQGGATTNQLLQWNGSTWAPATISTGSGTVTSVGLTMPSGFSVGSSPVTTSGTIAVTTTLNGPLRGNGSGFTTGNTSLTSEVSGILPIANGGTNLSALGTANQLLRVNSGATALEYFTPSFLTGNQTITLSGDVTGSGTTAITTTIANNAVTVAKMQTLAGLSVLGRSANSTGNMAAITGTAANQYLRVNSGGTALEWGTITAVTGSGAAGQGTYWTGTNTIAGSAAYLVDVTNGRIQLNTTGSAVTPTAHYEARVTSGTNDEMFRFVGNVAEVLGILRNDRNVSGAGSSVFEAQVGGANAGDPYTRYTVNGLNQWVVGIDNSDGDAFRILNRADPSSGSVGGEGVRIQTGVTTKVGINKTVAVEVMDVGGNIRGDVIKTQNTATATFAIGTGAGTGGSIDAANTRWRGNGGKCRFTVGTSPVANADVFTMTIGAAYKFTDADPVVSGSLPNSATGFYGFYDNATGKMTVRYSGTLAPGTYWVNFQMIGQ
jgi:hypothetical protein